MNEYIECFYFGINNNRFRLIQLIETITYTMLHIIASTIAHPKYTHLIELTQADLVIKNQHFFLWHVFPVITGKQVTKSQLIKQMGIQGLHLSKIYPTNQQGNHKQNQKTLRFKINNPSEMSYLKTVQAVTQQKERERQLLESKISSLTSKLQHIQPHSHNIMEEIQLIEEVSSLKQINRQMLRLNSEIDQLLTGFQQQLSKTREEDTYDFLMEAVKPSKCNKFYSMQLLEN